MIFYGQDDEDEDEDDEADEDDFEDAGNDEDSWWVSGADVVAVVSELIRVTGHHESDITSLRDADRVTGLLECDGIRDIKMIVKRVRTDMIRGEDMMSVLDVQEMLGL